MRPGVVITGAGVISPLGDTPAALHAALCAGERGLRPITLFDPAGLGCGLAGEVAPFSASRYLGARNLRPLDRTAQLAAAAAQLALDDSGWTSERRQRIELGLVVGTMLCGLHTTVEFDRRAVTAGPEYASPMDFANTVINATAGQLAIWHNLRGINSTISSGPGSGLHAIAYASDLVRRGTMALLAGGAEELCFESFYGFARAGLLCGSRGGAECPVPFHIRRNGFALAEGAAFVVLEDPSAAAARGARTLGEVRGHGCAYRPGGPVADTVARAIRLALADAGAEGADIDGLSLSASGSQAGDLLEAQGVAAALGDRAGSLPVSAIKSQIGDALGASGAFQVIAMLETIRDGQLPGIRELTDVDEAVPLMGVSRTARAVSVRTALVTSVAPEGHCCAVVLSAPT